MTPEPRSCGSATPDATGATALAVERAVRAAARAGNRLLAASTVRVLVEHSAARRVLLDTLARMGAREARSGSPADFVFVDAGATAFSAHTTAADEGEAPGLPPVIVGLDGSMVSPREASPAARLEWAERGMPATAALARELARGVGAGGRGAAHRPPRVAVSLVLEPKTAAFTRTLVAAGCEVAVFSAVSETDPEIARELSLDGRVTVFAPQTHLRDDAAREADSRHAAEVLNWAPDYLIDDGAHLIRLAHTEQPRALEQLRGAAEETTSGVRPLREMEAAGELRIPVIAVNDARTKTGFDNLIGTGQSCVFAICDLLDKNRANTAYTGAADTHWVIVGYGPVGAGTARFAAALGAEVTVVEHDPVRALAALHDGFEASGMASALERADVVVSATGVWHTVTAAHFAAMRPGTAVAVAGGIDDELALNDLRASGWTERAAGAGIDEWRAPSGAGGPIVLARGGGINYTAAEGNPIEVMDLSFATQVAALIRLMRETPAPGVHALSVVEEAQVARAALHARGGGADPAPEKVRAGGAAQPWPVHRYRTQKAAGETA